MAFGAASLCALLLSMCEVTAEETLDFANQYVTSAPRPLQEGIRLGWDSATLRRVSAPHFRSSGYARMIELDDGELLCVYEADGSIMATRSSNGGKTWAEPVPVAWHQDGINMAAPDVIQLKDGSILCCYNPRPWKICGSRTFGIRTRKSYDGGKTWIHGRLIYEAGHKFGDGCWEPAAIQLSSGEIQVYFANEGVFRKSREQNISMLSSGDGGLTWTTQPKVISFRKGSRDGMPAPLVLDDDDKTVVAIEDLGWLGYFKPAIVRSSTGYTWPEPVEALSPNRHAALAEPISITEYAGAPYLRQMLSGETVLSYQGTEGRKNHLHNADMKVVIGDSTARSFDRKSVPFDVPKNRYALWNSITVLRDGTVIALTSTNAFSFMKSEVWMIKGYVIPEVRVPNATLQVDGYELDEVWNGPLPLFTRRNGTTRYRGGVACDEENLYLYSRVTDENVSVESAEPESNDGVAVAIVRGTSGGDFPVKPDANSYKIFLTADNFLTLKQGKNERWQYREMKNGLQPRHASKLTEKGYVQEIAVPWELIGGRPSNDEVLAVNVSVTEADGSGLPKYRENLSGNHEDKPYTWLPLRLP